jgi:hypothetical protein
MADYGKQAKKFIRESFDFAQKGKCDLALDRLVHAHRMHGMAGDWGGLPFGHQLVNRPSAPKMAEAAVGACYEAEYLKKMARGRTAQDGRIGAQRLRNLSAQIKRRINTYRLKAREAGLRGR